MNVLIARVKTCAAVGVCAFILAACAAGPVSPEGSAAVRSKLTALQNDPELASRARVEIREAEKAVQVAEEPVADADAALGAHRVYMADHGVEIARAKATTKLAEDQRARLSEERDDARLAARTREADKAKAAATRERNAAASARSDAARARSDATDARSSEADLQRRLNELEAKETERGIVVTLGDVLFDTDSAQLRNADGNLNKLVSFLNQYSDRRVLIEGHTDNVGSATYNQGLSQRRAESVRHHLTQGGIASQRMSVSGMGLERPVASNNTAAGRQQNRRVEIVIENPEQSSPTAKSDSVTQR
jgi:outer membrane protein OmpA-like peptidoglycan-associated protein